MGGAGDTGWTGIAELELATDRATVAAFAAALGAPAEPGPAEPVPATYAFTVFSHPKVLARLADLAAERAAALVHQAQDFTFHAPLQMDRRYTVAVDWKRHEERADRLTLRGRVRGEREGTFLQEFRAEIVLFENREKGA
ncbi:hypothetical protein [Stappia sp. TSB10GB4]|uniref:hypothetical protein n=1 Tax=Stappia sp. TSB10GB4 TaxID=2003584 RepID=UPI001646B90E|nr:hypothetical protein [Stappia sp. TSB10GB4]